MLYLLLCVGSAVPRVAADTTLSLAAATSLAREANPRIVAARSAVAAAEAAARQAGALRDPNVVVAREQTSARVWQNTVSIDQPLEVFGQRSTRRNAGLAQVAVANRALAATVRSVEAEVATAYASAQAANRASALSDSIIIAFERAVRIVDSRVSEGDASGYEARRLKLEAARYEGTRTEAHARRQQAQATLAVLLGRDPTTAYGLTDRPEVRPLGIAADSLATLAATGEGAATVAAARAQAAVADLARLRGERHPVPSFGVGYKDEQAGMPGRLTGYVAQVTVPIPLWGSRSAAVAVGVAEVERLAALANEAALAARRDAVSAAGQVAAIVQHHSALTARLGAEADRARIAADAAFADGEMTLVEWIDAVRAFHEAAVEEANLTAQFVARVAELERLTGLTLQAR